MPGYIGVTCPVIRGKRHGWLAQHRKSGVWKKGFATRLEAARWLAAQLKVSVKSLVRSGGRRSGVPAWLPMSRYHGVVPRKRSASVLYEGRVGTQTPRTFATEKAAAAFVARGRGVPVKQLRKRQPFTRRLAKLVWRSAFGVFKRYRPGDLVHLLEMERKWLPTLFKQVVNLDTLLFKLVFPGGMLVDASSMNLGLFSLP